MLSRDPKDAFPNGLELNLPGVPPFEMFTLLHSTLAAGFQMTCATELYCCHDYYYDGEGSNCVSFGLLRNANPPPGVLHSKRNDQVQRAGF